jgi:hypothetical protein
VDGLVFTPTAHQLAPGQSVTTGFTISDTNSAGLTATDSATSVVATAAHNSPALTKPLLSYTVAEGQTLQGLYGQLLANAQEDVNVGAQISISSLGLSNTAGFLYLDASDQVLTYTADGFNAKQPTDSFTYTVTDQYGGQVTGHGGRDRHGTESADRGWHRGRRHAACEWGPAADRACRRRNAHRPRFR